MSCIIFRFGINIVTAVSMKLVALGGCLSSLFQSVTSHIGIADSNSATSACSVLAPLLRFCTHLYAARAGDVTQRDVSAVTRVERVTVSALSGWRW